MRIGSYSCFSPHQRREGEGKYAGGAQGLERLRAAQQGDQKGGAILVCIQFVADLCKQLGEHAGTFLSVAGLENVLVTSLL